MARSAQVFGRLLTEAVYRIEFRESKSLQIVQDELGYALERESGGSAIEYWRKGNIPARQADVERLAREIIKRSDLGRAWLERFLWSAGHPNPKELCEELFPPQTHAMKHPPQSASIGGAIETGEAFTPEFAPFVVGPPILHARQFFGREDEVKRIFGILSRFPLQNIAIIGQQRSGKTSLLHYVKNITVTPPRELRPGQRNDWLKQPEHYRWVFVDFQDARMSSQEGLLRYMLTGLALPVPDPCNLINFMDTVSRSLRTPTVILMDEIGAALASPELDQRFWWSLRSLGTNQTGGKLAFILTSHQSPDQLAYEHGKPSPFFNIFQRLDLGPLTEAAARDLIASSPQPFDPADVEWILSQSGHWPALLQILCQTHLAALSEGKTGQGWRIDGLRHIRPYRYLLGGSAGITDVNG